MDKQYYFLKKPYLPPRFVTVAFKVEDSFFSGGGSTLQNLLLPLSGSDGSGMQEYGYNSNDDGFWDRNLNSSGSTDEYDPVGWSWH